MIRMTLILALLMCLGAVGCSLLQEPELEGTGTVTLRFVGDDVGGVPSINGVSSPELARALPLTDSVLVCVYRPDGGFDAEVCDGVGMNPPADSVTLSLTVIAENNKRVAVSLFQAGNLLFFGVDENVDVAKGQNTGVAITATSFEMGVFWRNQLRVSTETPFSFFWNHTPGASAYVLEVSGTPDFQNPFPVLVVDTTLSVTPGTFQEGWHYFRVAATNGYAVTGYSNSQQIDIYGAPEITGFSPGEEIRGKVVTITGDDLDFPNTTVRLYGQECKVLSSERDQLVVEIPAVCFSDAFTITNEAGSGTSTNPLFVQAIAYVGVTDALLYKNMIDGFGGAILNSTVDVVSSAFVNGASWRAFDVIIIGGDTSWGSSEKTVADSIAASGAAIVGMGDGGVSYFQLMGYWIGQIVEDSRDNIYVYDGSSPIYNTPNSIPLAQPLIDIYASGGVKQSAVDANPVIPPVGVRVHALRDAPPSTLSPFIEQTVPAIGPGAQLNFLWGFTASPTRLTQNGGLIFENVVVYAFDSGTSDVVPADPSSGP
jgi:hypothetical protein